jgi:uncharacterized protein (DUF1015 family)
MAEIRPLRALHYDPARDPLQDVVAPPYDVIDDAQRAALQSRSPHNVVAIDLPQGDDPYAAAAETFSSWKQDGVLQHDDADAYWVLTQDYDAPDGTRRTRSGFFARVRVEDYGPGRIRPHERTHPGPKEDRLRLTRATKANLSPIFSLYSDPEQKAFTALETALQQTPFGEQTDDDGTHNRLWRVSDPDTITAVTSALQDAELLIADGHHRYETARVYADEIGGEGPHRYVLMCLVSLEDPGLTVFPTHRLAKGRGQDRYEQLAQALKAHFDIERVPTDEIAPPATDGPLELGYIDSHFKQAFRCRLKTQDIADRALADQPDAIRHLDTAVLEALLLKDALDLTEDDISHLHDFGYARDAAQAVDLVTTGEFDVAFVLRPTPVEQVRAVAASGVNMPPKSTYFFPKIPTGLLFNPLDAE